MWRTIYDESSHIMVCENWFLLIDWASYGNILAKNHDKLTVFMEIYPGAKVKN